jgi:hypothetical protein
MHIQELYNKLNNNFKIISGQDLPEHEFIIIVSKLQAEGKIEIIDGEVVI